MRTWKNCDVDDGSVHTMGNGEMVVFGVGPNIATMYGPPYSSSSILKIDTECSQYLIANATRELGTAVWNHELIVDDAHVLDFTEFVAAEMPAYVRIFNCKDEGISWVVKPNPFACFRPCKSISGAWQQIINPGQNIYSYPSNLWSYSWVIPQGSCEVELNSQGELVVRCLPGEGSLAVVGAYEYPLGMMNAEIVVRDGAASLLEPTRKYWKVFTDRRLSVSTELKDLPQDVFEALDSVAVLIKTEQSSSGGEIAGQFYPLAYIRDQYGTARGMLKLGMIDEARLNLEFRLRKYNIFGNLYTAESMGTDCARHIHENDQVEGPAYTILQSRDYINATGDNEFGCELWPMLEWCWNVQQEHATCGLLPFNGDETYVAGDFFPRSGLVQGSGDSTLVYIESGKWLVKWAVEQGFWTSGYAETQLSAVVRAQKAYRKYFIDTDRIWANAPERVDMVDLPRFRHGVCECRREYGCLWFGWTERNENGRYVCPDCMRTNELPMERPERMEVNSISLLPAYIGSDIISRDEMRVFVDRILSQAQSDGHIASIPGTVGCVGYDPGLILYNLVSVDDPRATDAFERVMRMLDSTSAWNEYYVSGDLVRDGSCRARPWESGINSEAVITYFENQK